MKYLFGASLLALAGTFVSPALAQPKEVPVPIVKAPYHRPVFTNQYLTLLDVYIPPGRNTGYHIQDRKSTRLNSSHT